MFTSQSAAMFYDKLFSSLDFTLPKAATGRRGFPKEAMVCAFIVMKCEGFSQITDLADYLDNNRLIAHYCGFNIMEPLPSYWTYDRFLRQLDNSALKSIMADLVKKLYEMGIVDASFIGLDSTPVAANTNVEVKAIFEEDAPPAPTNPAKPSISVTGTYTYNGSEHTAAVNGYDPSTMDIAGNTATDAGDYTVRVTSKTGKWADGSTDAVTAAWSIGKATQEAPIGLNGVAPTTEGGSDGKITGVDATMEYRAESEITYTACTGIEIENLSAGNYFVRYAEDHNHFASTDAEVTVAKGAPLADCTITFDGNGGSGSMGPVTVKAGANYILPDCGFTAPADQEFKAWEISGTEYKVGDSYTVLGDTEIKALWENSVITPTTYTVTVSKGAPP